MEKIVRNSVVLLLALFFLTIANGYNVVHFCCQECEEHGLRMFTMCDCTTVHTHHQCHEQLSSNCCQNDDFSYDDITTIGDDCSLSRISVDSSITQKVVKVVCFLPLIDVLYSGTIITCRILDTTKISKENFSPPPQVGREILSKIALLLI